MNHERKYISKTYISLGEMKCNKSQFPDVFVKREYVFNCKCWKLNSTRLHLLSCFSQNYIFRYFARYNARLALFCIIGSLNFIINRQFNNSIYKQHIEVDIFIFVIVVTTNRYFLNSTARKCVILRIDLFTILIIGSDNSRGEEHNCRFNLAIFLLIVIVLFSRTANDDVLSFQL